MEVATRFGDRFKVLETATNEGPAAARNRALKRRQASCSSFWTQMTPASTYLERLVGAYDDGLARGEKVGIVTCDARILGPDGYLPQTYLEIHGVPGEVTVARMLASNSIYGGALAPRDLVDEAGAFCPDLFGTEDWDLWLRILELGYRVVAVREALAVYRRRPTSVSSNLARMARSRQLTYRRALQRGVLTPRERRVAERGLRLQRAVERFALLRSGPPSDARLPAELIRDLPLFARVALENPGRWKSAIQLLTARDSSPMTGR